MAHPQHNFTSNFNGSEGHNAELTLNINGTEHKYTPAGNDKEFTVTGAVRINVNLDGSELVERITTVLNGESLPLLVQQNLDGTEDSYTYVGLQDNEWLFGRVTTTNIDSVGISTTDGSVRRETLPLASDVAIVSNTDPAVYTKLRTAVALGHLPVLDYQGTYATYVTIDNNILKFATESADPNVESYVYTVAPDNTVTATPRNAGVVRADSVDTEPGTLIDKLEVVNNVRDPEDPADPQILSLEVTVDGQGKRKVAINEDNLREFVGNVSDAFGYIADTLNSMDFDEVPHAYLGSTLFQSSGDPASTGTSTDVFDCTEPLVGDCFEFEQTTTIDDVPFGHIWLEPGTYIINASVKCQWVGVPRGTFMNKVGLVMGENFDFSQEQELLRSTTRIRTIPARTKLTINVTHDAGTPVMGFRIQSMQVVKLAGGMSQTNVAHDNTLTGQGSVADPLGVNTQNVAQSTLADTVAQAFDPTRDAAHKYLAGESVIYNGKNYTFKVEHYGAWADTDAYEQDLEESVLTPLFNELNQKKLAKKVGKNLFNKDTSYRTYGYYVGYSDGVAHTIADYYVFVVPVVGGDVLSFNKANINVCALSVYPTLSTLENGKKLIGYLGGISTAAQGYTVPAGAVCLVVSIGLTAADTYQIEKGASSTAYEQYKEGVDTGDVLELDSMFAQVDQKLANKLDKDRSKNFFNKNTTNKKPNSYVNYSTGNISSLSNWSAYVVEIPEGVTKVSISKTGAHSCAFSCIPDLTTASGAIPNYLGGVTGAGNQGWDLPAGTVCIVVSCADGDADVMQVESGATSTSYVPYTVGLDWSHVINKPSISEAKIRYVGAGQTYTTIQSAMNAAYDGDTIFIMPGVYNESLSNKTKSLKLVGFNRDMCIITHSAEHYSTPPLNIAKGVVENLTFRTTGLPASGDQGAYCVHIDWDQSINSALQFKNCKFESTSRPCAGIGLRENFILSFVDCTFKSSGLESPFYCHEQQESNKDNQRVELVNCTLENAGNNVNDACITLQETPSLSGNNAYLLVERCILKRTYGAFDSGHKAVVLHLLGGGVPSGNKYLNSNLWNLDFMSELNTESIVNASEQ